MNPNDSKSHLSKDIRAQSPLLQKIKRAEKSGQKGGLPVAVYFVMYEFMDGVFRSEVPMTGGSIQTYLWSPWRVGTGTEMWNVSEYVSDFQMEKIGEAFCNKYGGEIWSKLNGMV